MNKILAYFLLFGISVTGQISERFDSIGMIKEQNWIDHIRKKIIIEFSNIDDYGVVIVQTSSGDYTNFTVFGLRQIRTGDDDPLSQQKPTKFSFAVFSDGGKKLKLEETIVSRKQFAESTHLFATIVKNARLNAMPSKSSSDKEYYIFSKIMNSTNETAIGQFSSCVLVEPDLSHPALLEIGKLNQYFTKDRSN